MSYCQLVHYFILQMYLPFRHSARSFPAASSFL